MDGVFEKGVHVQVPRPTRKWVIPTMRIYDGKLGDNGEVLKYK